MASNEPPYEVGYGKPPKSTRFSKGRSGNPSGRPKQIAAFGPLFEQAMGEKVMVNEQGRRKRISRLRLMIKQIANKAASGDRHFIKLALVHLRDSDLMRGRSADPLTPADLEKLSAEELSALYAERINATL